MKMTRRLLALLIAVVMLAALAVPALALDPFAYDGDAVTFITEDGSAFGMFAAQEGTTCVIDGDNVVIHYVPKNTTVYNAIHWGTVNDAELTADVTFNGDGTFDIVRPKTDCGKAYPVAPIKPAGGTTSSQYYLAIPAEDKLPVAPLAPFDYEGDGVTFIKEDGSAFGMFAPQEGTTCVINGDTVVIHYVPKNTTTYNAIHWGAVDDAELTADLTFNGDGTFDIVRPKTDCGKAYPVAPIKASDGGTTSAQYYLAIPAADKLQDVTPVEPFGYDGDAVNFIKADGAGFGMFAPQEGTTCVINGDNVVIHYVPKNTTTYNAIHWGTIDDAELTADVTFNEDGSFDIVRPKTDCGKAYPVAPIKASDGGTTSSQYYLAIPAADKLQDVTPVEPPVVAPTRTDLTITNTTGMFKGLYAFVETDASGAMTLTVALTGSTYRYLYRGNYAQAVANGDNRSAWITGQQDSDGKWYFEIPVTASDTYMPMVSISQTYLDKYEAGENPLERAFYPRQFELDLTAKTITIGDYDETISVSVTSRVDNFKVDSSATMRVIGGPNSNNFSVSPTLRMLDGTYDQVTYPTVVNGAIGEATAALTNGEFAIEIHNAPNLAAFNDKQPIAMQFRNAETGEKAEFTLTIDLLARTIVVDGEGGGSSSGGDGGSGEAGDGFTDVPDGMFYTEAVAWAVENGVTTGTTATTFEPDTTCTRGQVVTFLWRAAGEPAAEGENPFTDVAEGSFYYDAVLWAVANGVTTGTSATTFEPDAPCTRGQVVTFLWRAAGRPAAQGDNPFTDVAEGEFYTDAVLWAVANGITTGTTDNTFSPAEPCTRGQVVTFLWRELQ